MCHVTESLICLIDSNTILSQKLLAACRIAASSLGKESRWDWNTLFLPVWRVNGILDINSVKIHDS